MLQGITPVCMESQTNKLRETECEVIARGWGWVEGHGEGEVAKRGQTFTVTAGKRALKIEHVTW